MNEYGESKHRGYEQSDEYGGGNNKPSGGDAPRGYDRTAERHSRGYERPDPPKQSSGYKAGGYVGKPSGGYGGKPTYKPPEFRGMYKTYGIALDQNTTPEAKDNILSVCRELDDDGWIMRVSATEPELLAYPVTQEVVLPFSSFDYDGKHEAYYPSKHAKLLAQLLTPGWDNIPEKAHSFVVHNWSLMVGRHLNSTVEFLITWTPDGITDGRQCSKDTGYRQAFLSIADKYNSPIFNFKNVGEDRRTLEYAGMYYKKPNDTEDRYNEKDRPNY